MNAQNFLRAAAFPVLTTVPTFGALAQSSPGDGGERYYWGPGMMWSEGHWGGFGIFLGPVFMILLLVAIVAGIMFLVRAFSGASPSARGDTTSGALAILNERFARGEIDAKEYEERKKKLLG